MFAQQHNVEFHVRAVFLGVTVHWLDAETVEGKGGCLAIRQLSGSHTYDLLAKTLKDI